MTPQQHLGPSLPHSHSRSRTRSTPPWVIVVVVLIILVGIALGIGVAQSAGPNSAAAAMPSGTPSATTSTPTPTPTPANAQTTLAVQKWNSHGGAVRLASVKADFDRIQTAAGAGNADAALTACQSLKRDVAAGQKFAPIPFAAAQKPWAAALTEFKDAVGHCIVGASHRDGTELSVATAKIQTGANYLTMVTTALEPIIGY